jgi:putative hydrolase of the HAD superfamily
VASDLRVVLFDAGNTLVFVEPARALEVLVSWGAPDDVAVFEAAERTARLRLTELLSDPAPPPEVEAWRRYFGTLLAELGIESRRQPAAGRALWEAHERDHMWTRTDPRTAPALQRLRDEGYRLGVVSNADGRMPGLIERVGLAGLFEFVVDSHLVGAEKPDARIFHAALDRLATGADAPRADECLYVGDLYAVDVVGARGAGLRPVLLEPFGQYADRDLDVDRIPDVASLPDWLGSRAATP